jgi:hypothetical protein
MKIELDTSKASKFLSDLAVKQVPYALKEAVNSLSKDIIKHEQSIMRSVFDRPTPFVESGLRIKTWATKESPIADIGFKDVFGRMGSAVESALAPHIPGYESQRREKGMERWLRARGFMDNTEWLVPSRTMTLDRFGNVPGSVASKMLADVGAYRALEGTKGMTTFRKKRGVAKAKYLFGEVKSKRAGTVKGIWSIRGGRDNHERGAWSLQMVVVNKRPSYRKRFDFYGEAGRYAEQHYARHLIAAIDKAVATARP